MQNLSSEVITKIKMKSYIYHKKYKNSYFILEVNIMNERAIKGVVVDAGHGGIG